MAGQANACFISHKDFGPPRIWRDFSLDKVSTDFCLCCKRIRHGSKTDLRFLSKIDLYVKVENQYSLE